MTFPQRPDPIQELTGQLTTSSYPGGIDLPGAGEKFATDGRVQIWKGNTFVCHITPDMEAYQVFMEIQETVKRSEFSSFFTYLPAPSFHMTIFNGMSPGQQFTSEWPDTLDPNWSRDRVSAEWITRVKDLMLPQSFRVRMTDIYTLHSATMVGSDTAEEEKLRQTRRDIKEATGLNLANLDSFVFHVSLAYLISFVSEPLAREMVDFSADITQTFTPQMPLIDLGPVEFCNFDSMHHFEPLLRIGA